MCFDGDFQLKSKHYSPPTQARSRKGKVRQPRNNTAELAAAPAPAAESFLFRLPIELRLRTLQYVITDGAVYCSDSQEIKYPEPFKLSARLICPEGDNLLSDCKQLNSDSHAPVASAYYRFRCALWSLQEAHPLQLPVPHPEAHSGSAANYRERYLAQRPEVLAGVDCCSCAPSVGQHAMDEFLASFQHEYQ